MISVLRKQLTILSHCTVSIRWLRHLVARMYESLSSVPNIALDDHFSICSLRFNYKKLLMILNSENTFPGKLHSVHVDTIRHWLYHEENQLKICSTWLSKTWHRNLFITIHLNSRWLDIQPNTNSFHEWNPSTIFFLGVPWLSPLISADLLCRATSGHMWI